MSNALVTTMLVLGLAVVVVRRRTVAIVLVAAQAVALGMIAAGIGGGSSADPLVGAFLIATKALALPVLLYVLIRRTPEAGPVAAAAGPFVRFACAGAVALCAVLFVPPLGLGDPHVEHVSVALVLVGMAIVVVQAPDLLPAARTRRGGERPVAAVGLGPRRPLLPDRVRRAL